MVVVRKTDEDVEAMKSTPSGMHHSFGFAESEYLGSEKILNTGVFHGQIGAVEDSTFKRRWEAQGIGSALQLQ